MPGHDWFGPGVSPPGEVNHQTDCQIPPDVEVEFALFTVQLTRWAISSLAACGVVMDKKKYLDPFLEKRLVKYDEWLAKGLISCSSRVIPVAESFSTKQWVLPTEQVLGVLQKADSLAVQDCECRTHYKMCDKPLEVCFMLNSVADAFVRKGRARHVDLPEAAEILKKANAKGLVHLGLYMPDHELFALCSCCPCCCHDLQIVKQFERKDLMVHSEYLAVTLSEDCLHCGDCVDRCAFGARGLRAGKLAYISAACLGCGLCVTTCPAEAISMEMRAG